MVFLTLIMAGGTVFKKAILLENLKTHDEWSQNEWRCKGCYVIIPAKSFLTKKENPSRAWIHYETISPGGILFRSGNFGGHE